MSNKFNQRVYGCAIIKSINSNYNADFSHQPRTLPDGVVYATDKALKWTIRNYWKKELKENIMYFKHLNKDMVPEDLVGLYNVAFKTEVKDDSKEIILKNLLSTLDVRLFGATFAPKGTGIEKKSISIHGTCQVSHAINRFNENVIYTEQILAPFTAPGDENEAAKGNTTLGSQSKLAEGHYVHHFSVNPKNIEADIERVKGQHLSSDDIDKLKEGLRKGVSYYDSSAKIGTDNECLVWVELTEGSKDIMPSFVDLVSINANKEIDFNKLTEVLKKHETNISKVQIYYNKTNTVIINYPVKAELLEI